MGGTHRVKLESENETLFACVCVRVRVRFDYHLLRETRKTADGSLVVVG